LLSPLQVWLSSVAAPDGASGHITSSVVSNAGQAAGRLRIEAVHVLGVPAPANHPDAFAASVTVNGRRGVRATYDAAAGALKLAALDLVVGEPMHIKWG
jgi:hypothetical protein